MSFPKHLLLFLVFFSGSCPILLASFPILPEVQVYHTVGSRGSTYSTGALGLSLHLYDEPQGPGNSGRAAHVARHALRHGSGRSRGRARAPEARFESYLTIARDEEGRPARVDLVLHFL